MSSSSSWNLRFNARGRPPGDDDNGSKAGSNEGLLTGSGLSVEGRTFLSSDIESMVESMLSVLLCTRVRCPFSAHACPELSYIEYKPAGCFGREQFDD